MPGLQTIPRRRPRIDDDEEEDDDDDDGIPSSDTSGDATPLSQKSNTSKRMRLASVRNIDDDNDDPSEEGSGDETDSSAQAEQSQIPTSDPLAPSNGISATYDSNGYRTGAIVRVKLTDFVTYTSVEFFPGPKLNMVIGPNGTGKSTLVCAICLGLGWGPQHLGRAKDPGEFVKHGCREAHIEIELAGAPRYRRNPVITRTIKRDGNKSTFTLDGKPASKAEVLKLAQSLYIQIDNLCQFLPQDKVSEFAALTPIELLHSTERAAVGPQMLDWHENLKKLRAEQKRLQSDNQGDKDLLANLESRQEMQRADVERMRQRDQIKRKIEILETARPIIKYKEFHAEFRAAKERKAKLEKELGDLEKQLEPRMRAATAKQSYCNRLKDVVQFQERLVDKAEASTKAMDSTIEQVDEQMKELNARIDSERKTGISYRTEIKRVQQTINKLERQKKDESVDFNPDHYNAQLKEVRTELRQLTARADEIQHNKQPLIDQRSAKMRDIGQAEHELRALESKAGQQEAKLKHISPDSFQAYRWVLENQDKFEKEVFGPPIVTCSINDPKYADAVESLFQRTDLTAFTTQTRNDFKTLQTWLNGRMKLHDISIRTCSVNLETFTPPLSDDDVKSLGLEIWARNCLSGPDVVLAMLCSEKGLHQTPISLRDITDEQHQRILSGSLSSFVAGPKNFQITRRREYGPSAVSTKARPLRPARVWTSQPIDLSAKRELESKMREWKLEVGELLKKLEADRDEMSASKEQYSVLLAKKEAIESEKAAKQTALTQYRALPEKIAQQESKKRDIDRLLGEIKERVIHLRDQQDQLSIQKAEATVDYAVAVAELQKQHQDFVNVHVRLLEGMSDVDVLNARNTQCRQQLDSKRAEAEQAGNYLRTQADKGHALRREATSALQTFDNDPESKGLLQEQSEKSMDQLEADIDSEKARLELTHGASRNVIKEFEDRERQIQKLQTKLADFATQLSDYDHAINEIRSKWEPRLDALIKRISDAFSDSFARIGCAGQVSLDKAEDEPGPDGQAGGSNFDQWSIQIHVKFREHENLSLLDSHRQSGGERAVSTIFYLMALQSLSASPFRVVDEINQGMDPRNERMVHERLVDIACANGDDGNDDDTDNSAAHRGGQYFLITPKLLSGLVYKPGMKVLCIVSGEHMPDDYEMIDFGKAISRMKEVTAKAKGKRRVQGLPGREMRENSVNGHVDVQA